ncbi:hypothetical protein GCM10022247_12140 [Allokutzneria multivorans]|uniref:Integral membrane protein n=1 Tax=Allokutzneria multivorans TaxID=1142134 RepID=A0ABP7R8W2_9PSEU
MEENLNAYFAFLIVGAILVIADGQLIMRASRGYLRSAYADEKAANSMGRMIGVLFHIITLGLLMLLSTVNIPVEGAVQQVVTKLGIVLLLLGAAHAVALSVLRNMRERQSSQLLTQETNAQFEERRHDEHQQQPNVNPSMNANNF